MDTQLRREVRTSLAAIIIRCHLYKGMLGRPLFSIVESETIVRCDEGPRFLVSLRLIAPARPSRSPPPRE